MPEIMGRPKKESYETAFEAFLAEAKKKNEDEKVKAEEKKFLNLLKKIFPITTITQMKKILTI
jgi:hypothetical protein